MNILERTTKQALKSSFPHFSIKFTPKTGYTLILSSGHTLELGHVHPSMLEHLFTTVKTINMLSNDPKMISKKRLNSQLN